MTQPKFAPILPSGEVRDIDKLPTPSRWRTHRPADFAGAPAVQGRGRGTAGPDQGYAMLLAERFRERVELGEGDHPDDALSGATVVAMRRAALFGRAPVATDIELALRLLGYLSTSEEGSAPPGGEALDPTFAAARRSALGGIAHDYRKQRALADLVPEETLRLSPPALAERLAAGEASMAELSGLGTESVSLAEE